MSKEKFEVGRYYKHTTGKIIKIVGAVMSDTYGMTAIAEDMSGNFKPVGTDESHTINWSQIPRPRPAKSEDAPNE